jgi:hypothetical protein
MIHQAVRMDRRALVSVVLLFSAGAVVAQTAPLREERRHDEKADLAATSLTVTPPFPTPGEAAQIRVEIKNRTLDAANGVEVAVYAGRQLLQTRTVNVAPSSATTLSVAWTPAAGVQTLSAIIDPRQRLTERDRLDNTITADVAVAAAPPAGADLSVESVEAVTAADKPGVLRVVVRNAGTVRGSAPLVIRRNGKQAAIVLPAAVDPGGRVTLEIPWTDPDAGSVRAEINPRFKRQARDIERAPSVDLRIAGLALQTAQLEPGKRRRVFVSFRIVNAGRDAITRPFRTTIEPGVPDFDGGIHPFIINTPSLRAGGVVHVSHTIEDAPADFDAVVKTDVDNAIPETDETNNRATLHFSNPSPNIDRWVSIGPLAITNTAGNGYGWLHAIGRLSAIAIDPGIPSTIYVGAQSGGVWKTSDGGANWEPLADSATVRVAALALVPGNPARVILVTPHDGVFRSEDAGTSWVQVSTQDLNAIVHGNSLLVHPTRTNELLIASDDGVYRSIDSGATWTLTRSGGSATGLIRLPNNNEFVLAAIFNRDSDDIAGIYESFDDGANWRSVAGCPGGSLPGADKNTIIHVAASGAQLFASYRQNDPRTFRLFRTGDTGCSVGGQFESGWEAGWAPTGDVDGEPIPSTLWSGMWADPTDPQFVYLGGTHIWRSTNRGGSFSRTSSLGGSGSAHSDHHNIAIDPQTPGTVYSLDDGGIYKSTSHGESGSWKFVGDGIANVELYDHVSAPLAPNIIIGGAQDNGTLKTDGPSTLWREIRGDDGATVDIDAADPKIFYSMEQYVSSIARSTNGGDSFSGAAGSLPGGSTCFNLHYQVHPRQSATLVASCDDLWRSTNSGSSWSKLFTPPATAGSILRTAIDGQSGMYYAGSATGVLFEGQGGAGFHDVFTAPVAMGITDIEIDPDDRRTLYLGLAGGGAGRVVRLVRSGTGFAQADITSDLPTGRTVQTVAIDRNHRFTIFAGTDRGVFRGRSLDNGATWFWLPYDNGLPAQVDVRDLEVHPGTGVMRAATFGRSAFEVNTDPPMGSVLASEGKVTFLRVHDPGTGFGPPLEFLDAEVIVQLDSEPGKSFGFQLRNDGNESQRRGMLDLLRNAFRRNEPVRIEYTRTSIHNGVIFRVVKLH